jgi:hypothetical protein
MTSGFPGLLAKNLNLGNNDVAGGVSGNILCIDCTSMYDYAMPEDKEQAIKEEINCTSNCNVAGNIYGGPIAMPPVLKFPSSLLNLITFSDITNSTTITWSASSSSNNGRCATDGNGVMHCLVRNIKLNNNTLTFFAPTSPYERRIRVYITGGVELKGQATINTYSTSGGPSQPWQLSLFGLEDNNPSIDCATDDGTNSLLTGSTALASGNQKIELSGKNQINAFIYFPKGCFNFNGGQLSKPEVYGAVWVKGYIQNGGGGNGAQYANIEVPPNMGSKLHEQTNLAYGLSIKDYAARGVKSWQLFQAN